MSFTKVDDYDLYALLYAGDESDENSENITPEQALQSAEEVNGRVKSDNDTDTADVTETTENSENTSKESEQPKQNSMNMNTIEEENEIVEDDEMNFYDNQDDEE